MSDTPSVPPTPRGVSRRLIGGLTAGAVLAASAGMAFADTVYIQALEVRGAPGSQVTFQVALHGEDQSNDPDGCNATVAAPVTIKFPDSSNTAVAPAPDSVTVTGCDNSATDALENAATVTVNIASTAPRQDDPATTKVVENLTVLEAAGAGGLVTSNGKNKYTIDKINVYAVGKQNQAALTVTGPTGGTFGQTYPITTSGGSGTGALSYEFGGGCAADGADKVKVTSGSTDCSITATKAGDTTYNSVTSAAAGVVVSKAAQGTLAVSAPSSGVYGDLLTLSSSGGSGTGAVSFAPTGSACQLTNGKLEILSGTGTCSVTASKATDANYLEATSAAHAVSIGKAAQADVTMTSRITGTYGDVFTLTSSGGTGTGSTSYAATGGACTIEPAASNQLEITSGTGTCSVTATKAADANYAAKSSAAQTITASKAAQTGLAVAAASTGKFDTTVALATTGGSGSGAVTYDVTGAACELTSAGLKMLTGTGSCSVTATKAADGNHESVTSPAHTVTAGKAEATVQIDGLSRTYNGSPQGATVTTSPANLSGVSLKYDDESAAPTNAGTYTVVAALDHPDYAGSDSDTLTISPKSVTGTFTVSPKTYDGSEAATVATKSVNGKVGDDAVSVDVTDALFADKNVGTGKAVTGTVALTGAAAGNYTLSSATASSTGTITAKELRGSVTAKDKVYDRSTAAEVLTRSLPGVISPDAVSLNITDIAFDSKDVGSNKPVSANLGLGGADAGNYTLEATTAETTANITAKPVTGAFTVQPKQYDGTRTATLADKDLPGIIAGDSVTLDLAGLAFDTKTVGTAKTAHADLSLAGAQAGNYALTAVNGSATAAITSKAVNGSFTAVDKVYNGSTAAEVTNLIAAGVIAGDSALLTVTDPTFATAGIGSGKTVTGAVALTGADAGNYSVNSSATSTASITARPVTGSFTANDRAYDGTTAATVKVASLSNAIDGDAVELDVTGLAFADTNVGTGKTVAGTLSLKGTASSNYTLSADSKNTATASITAKAVTGSFTAANKAYDGNTTATITGGTVVGALAGDAVTLNTSGATATFDTPTAGVDKTVTGSGFSLTGTGSANYTLTSVATAKATITPWSFSGFRQPVDGSGVFNRAKAGSAIPVKFSLAGNKGLDIFATGSPSSKQITCPSGATVDDIEELATASTSNLQYDAVADQYNYVWKTSTWGGTCRQLTVTFKDGKSYTANFTFTK